MRLLGIVGTAENLSTLLLSCHSILTTEFLLHTFYHVICTRVSGKSCEYKQRKSKNKVQLTHGLRFIVYPQILALTSSQITLRCDNSCGYTLNWLDWVDEEKERQSVRDEMKFIAEQ